MIKELFSVLFLAACVSAVSQTFKVSGEYHRMIADDFKTAPFDFVIVSNPSTNTHHHLIYSDEEMSTLGAGDWIEMEVKEVNVVDIPHKLSGEERMRRMNNPPKVMQMVKLLDVQKKIASPFPNNGTRAILFVRMNYINAPENSCDEACLLQTMWTNSLNVNNGYIDSSYGLLSIPQELGKIVTVSIPVSINVSACDYPIPSINTDAATAVMQQFGIDVNDYDLVSHYSQACCALGLGEVGGKNSYLLVNDADGLSHELGHNFGYEHAASDLGDNQKKIDEYGDHSSIMGVSGIPLRGFNAPNRILQNWLPQLNVLHLDVNNCATVTYPLTALETPPAPGNLQAIVFDRRINNTNYFISYRNNASYDINVPTEFRNKVSVHYWAGGYTKTYITAALAASQTLVIPLSSVTLNVLSMTQEQAWVSLETCTTEKSSRSLEMHVVDSGVGGMGMSKDRHGALTRAIQPL